jgi:hypothetical protein
MGLACHNFADGNPMGSDNYFPATYPNGASGAGTSSFYSAILGYIEEGNTTASSGGGTKLGFSVCPSYKGTTVAATYYSNVGTSTTNDNGGMRYIGTVASKPTIGLPTAEFKNKGLSKVAMIGESSTGISNWHTGTVHVINAGYSSNHTGGLIGICKADGSVEFVTSTAGLITRDSAT